jgi:hypothetical protein
MQFEECPQLVIPEFLGIGSKAARLFYAALQGLRRALDPDALGLSQRNLRPVPALLWPGAYFMAAELLPAAGNLEAADGLGSQTATLRILPQELR